MKNISLLLLLLLTSCGGSGSSNQTTVVQSNPVVTPPPPPPPKYTRQLEDQPDRYSDLRYVHIIYAVPSDQDDLGRDKNYSIQTSLLAANNWFSHNTSGKTVRLDVNSDNDVDITYWKYDRTNADILTTKNIFTTIYADAKLQPWYKKDKLYVIYFEGSHNAQCGQTLIGRANVAVLYLKDSIKSKKFDCSRIKFATNINVFKYWEGVFLHETIHMLGVRHTADYTGDLMYSGSDKTPNNTVDYNNDDYYMTSDSTEIDIYYSAFLEPLDGNQLPKSMK